MTDAEVVAAIRGNHLKANINDRCIRGQHWDRAWLDPGGTIFGPGPYVKLQHCLSLTVDPHSPHTANHDQTEAPARSEPAREDDHGPDDADNDGDGS